MLLYIHHLKGCLYLNVWRQKHWVSCILVTFTILVSQNYYQKGLFLSTNQMFSDRSDLVKTPLFFWPVWSRSTSHMHILKAFGWWLLLILCFRVFAKYLYFFFYHNWEISLKTSICSYFSENLFLIPAVWISMLSLWLHSGYGTVQQQRRENKEPLEIMGH